MYSSGYEKSDLLLDRRTSGRSHAGGRSVSGYISVDEILDGPLQPVRHVALYRRFRGAGFDGGLGRLRGEKTCV
eukprot:1278636-Amorphochlora_amoeboformis.AAC.1